MWESRHTPQAVPGSCFSTSPRWYLGCGRGARRLRRAHPCGIALHPHAHPRNIPGLAGAEVTGDLPNTQGPAAEPGSLPGITPVRRGSAGGSPFPRLSTSAPAPGRHAVVGHITAFLGGGGSAGTPGRCLPLQPI